MKYDLIVVGGGPAGYVSAIRASQYGLKVCLIERNKLGGTCLNVGCIPTKFLLKEGKKYRDVKNYLVNNNQDIVIPNQEKIYSRCSEVVNKNIMGINSLLKSYDIEVVNDTASIKDGNVTLSTGEILTTKNIIIATGSKVKLPNIPGINEARILTSDEVLKQPVTGDSLAIIGGGIIGVELANYFVNLGKEVTIYEASPNLIPFAPKDLRNNLSSYLKSIGVKIVCNAFVEKLKNIESGICLTLKEEDHNFNEVIVCTGRRGSIIEGLQANERDFLVIDENYKVKDNIYAVGDVNGKSMLAHSASSQGLNVVEHLVGGADIKDLNLIPSCIYTDIEVSYVGVSEEELTLKQQEYKISKFMMGGNSIHTINSTNRGYIKVIIVEDKVIGAELFCLNASELISFFTLMIGKELNISEVSKLIYPHPSLSEGILEVLESSHNKAIHVAKSFSKKY